MQLSRENGFFDVKGTEVYVKKGVLYADDDPAVKAVPQIFDKVSDDAPKSARAEAGCRVAGGGGEGRFRWLTRTA